MVSIPGLKSYSDAEITRAQGLSPALSRYLSLHARFSPLAVKRNAMWAEAALATLLKRGSTEEITKFWSVSADALLREAWTIAGLDGLPASLLGLGKLGAGELNLSSDVDLILICEPAAAEQVHRRIRRFRQALAPGGSQDQILRLDFDLRPGGRFGPIVTTVPQMRDYYWNQGETWERLAWVRARVIAGDSALGADILSEMAPYSYRKFLDFTVMEDLKLLRSRIQNSLQLSPGQVHLKLGRGGIRDLELFVHSLQIIHGGRRPELRTHSTSLALKLLEDHKVLPAADARFLMAAYWRLRHWENSVQAVDDRQVHGFDLDRPSAVIPDAEKQECLKLCVKIDALVSSLLGPVRDAVVPWPEDPEGQAKWLEAFGVPAATAQEVWPQLQNATALSKKSERDEKSRREFLSQYLSSLKEHGLDMDLGLRTLLDFIKSTRAKATFFSLLLREPNLTRDLAHLFSVSPYLGHLIASHPELLDSFLSQRQGDLPADGDLLLEQLTERRSLTELMAASQFLNTRDCVKFGRDLTDAADQICQTLLEQLRTETGAEEVRILALGKWGGGELGVRSDLDFVFLVENEPTEREQRLARRMISRLTQTNRAGRLYAVDLRLRPSGHAGPILAVRHKLNDYLACEAPPWVRQAYLRARVVGDGGFSISECLLKRPLDRADLESLREIRSKLIRPVNENSPDLKFNPGGLVSIEFSAQLACLRAGVRDSPADTLGMLARLNLNPKIAQAYAWLRTIEQLHQLTSNHSGSILEGGSSSVTRLARIMKTTAAELLDEVLTKMAQTAVWLDEADPLR